MLNGAAPCSVAWRDVPHYPGMLMHFMNTTYPGDAVAFDESR